MPHLVNECSIKMETMTVTASTTKVVRILFLNIIVQYDLNGPSVSVHKCGLFKIGFIVGEHRCCALNALHKQQL